MAAAAEPLDGPSTRWAGELARELGIDLVAGSIVRGRGRRQATTPRCTPAPTARRAPSTASCTCSTSRSPAPCTASPSTRARATRSSSRALADGAGLGMTICYDLRFPELYRALSARGARVIAVPAAFTLTTTRDHWEVLLRARAIENQAFVVAANQVGEHPPGLRSGGRSMIVDPWGVVLAQAPDDEGVDRGRPRLRAPGRDAGQAARRSPTAATACSTRCTPDGRHRPRPGRGRPPPPDPRRRRPRVRPAGLPRLPRLRHRRRGGRRLRPRLPLLPLQGGGARHPLPRALGRARGHDRRGGGARGHGARATSCT